MQSGVAEKLDDVLRDKKAREELRELLRKGKSGRVTTADGKTYKVNTEVGGNRDS